MHKHLTDKAYSDRFTLYDYCSIVPELCRQGKTIRSFADTGYAYHVDAGLFRITSYNVCYTKLLRFLHVTGVVA